MTYETIDSNYGADLPMTAADWAIFDATDPSELTFEIAFTANNGGNVHAETKRFRSMDEARWYAITFLADWWQDGAFANVFCVETEAFRQVTQ